MNALDRLAIGNHSDVAELASNVTVGAAVVAPLAFELMDVELGVPLVEDLTVYAEALTVNGALVTIAKNIAQRPMPIVYAGLAPDLVKSPAGYRSFYSGHEATAVTALMVASTTYTLRHGDTWWPWLVTAGVGLTVAVEKIAAGRHFPSDIAVGALAGVVVGWGIPALHKRVGLDLSLASTPDGTGAVVALGGRL